MSDELKINDDGALIISADGMLCMTCCEMCLIMPDPFDDDNPAAFGFGGKEYDFAGKGLKPAGYDAQWGGVSDYWRYVFSNGQTLNCDGVGTVTVPDDGDGSGTLFVSQANDIWRAPAGDYYAVGNNPIIASGNLPSVGREGQSFVVIGEYYNGTIPPFWLAGAIATTSSSSEIDAGDVPAWVWDYVGGATLPDGTVVTATIIYSGSTPTGYTMTIETTINLGGTDFAVTFSDDGAGGISLDFAEDGGAGYANYSRTDAAAHGSLDGAFALDASDGSGWAETLEPYWDDCP